MASLDALKLSATTRAALDRLEAGQRAALETLLADAQRAQEAALHRANEAALAHVPTLLRGPVRRILGT